MRLLYFTRSWTGHDERFARGFLSHGIELGVVTLQACAAPMAVAYFRGKVDFVRSLGLEGQLDDSTSESLVKEYAKLEKAFAPEVVLAGPLTDCAYIKALAVSNVPFVAQSWAFDVLWEARREDEKYTRCRKALKHCSGLFADCDAVVRACEMLLGRSLAQIFVAPWGLEQAPTPKRGARDVIRNRLDITTGYVFLHTRGLESVYSVETLLEAFAVLHRAVPDTILLLASTGSLQKEVESIISRSGLERAALLLGPLSHHAVLELLGAADCYVSCAASDGTSVTLLEAMREGLPVIVPDVGGNPEWVRPGANGWITQHGNAMSLVAAMQAATSVDTEVRLSMAKFSRVRVAERANWPANLRQLGEFLRQQYETT